VYGLVCDAINKKSVKKIFSIKKRPLNKPLAVFVKDIKMAKRYANINKKQEKILKRSWPGAITFILKALPAQKTKLSPLVYKGRTIGIRIPDYVLMKKIFKEFYGPLAQTSANISGEPAVTRIKQVLVDFAREDIVIIDAGDLPKSKPSKIIDLTGKKVMVLRR